MAPSSRPSITAITAKAQTTVVFINQIRMKIGVMFGNPETTSGGRALKFYTSVRMELRRIGSIKEGEKDVQRFVQVVDVLDLMAVIAAINRKPRKPRVKKETAK